MQRTATDRTELKVRFCLVLAVLGSENSPKFPNRLRTGQNFHLKYKKKHVKQLVCDVEM